MTVDYLDYRDLDKDKYTEAVFSDSEFLDILRTSSSSGTELFSSVESIEYDVFNEQNADLFVQRYTDVNMYLKCLETDGYGPDVANVLIEGMDKFFEMYVEDELESVILGQVPDGKVRPYVFDMPWQLLIKFSNLMPSYLLKHRFSTSLRHTTIALIEYFSDMALTTPEGTSFTKWKMMMVF